jgi:nucleoside-diphosphate-sugar epimerase
MKIVVTGGTGFLGREIVNRLMIAGHEVVALSRGQTTSRDQSNAVRFVQCDINNRESLILAFESCDCVVHSAALSSPWGSRKDFLRQNAEGTASVVSACETTGVRRLVHISSSSVYFSFHDQHSILEDCVLPKPVNAYAESKQKAEIAVSRFKDEVFILRPRGIYGPGDLHLLPRLLRVMKSRPLPLLRSGEALVDITDVSVVADAVLNMIEAEKTGAGTYNVSHGEPISIRALVNYISAGLNVPCRWRKLPVAMALSAARLLETMARIDPRNNEPLVTAYSLGLFAYSHSLDISKAQRELNWRPKLSLHDGLQRTFRHFRETSQ